MIDYPNFINQIKSDVRKHKIKQLPETQAIKHQKKAIFTILQIVENRYFSKYTHIASVYILCMSFLLTIFYDLEEVKQ